jgi:pyruvate dehydrogenase E2 component (dihydrolipoamide acetyltransferase)
MAVSIFMPALEIAQETGKIVSWRKKEGDRVAKGEPLLEIETDKAVVEIESPADGILAAVQATIGDVIPVGNIIAWLVAPGETPPSATAQPQSARQPAQQAERQPQLQSQQKTGNPSAPAASPIAGQTAQPPTLEIRISPKARRLAREHGIEIASLDGSGPGGEVLAADILAAVSARDSGEAAPAPIATEALSTVARLMAERTTQSWTTVPHFFLVREVDARGLIEANQTLSREAERLGGTKPTLTDLLTLLVARILPKHPRLNSSWTGDAIARHPHINIGMAMATSDAVVVSVIHNADAADLAKIAARRSELAGRATSGKLQPSDVAGATFTISNLGMYGVDAFTAIIVPPQAAILAVGRIADRVVAVDGIPAVRRMLTLTLSSDHRVVDGVRAAEFLNDLTEAIGAPDKWLK